MAIVEAVAAPLGIRPVVVGGMAVYFWTASDAFLTFDIDVVMEVPERLANALVQLGFTRAADGRHWTLEGYPQQVLALLDGLSDKESADLDARAPRRRVSQMLAAMRALGPEIAEGRAMPASHELHEIARAALDAEYA